MRRNYLFRLALGASLLLLSVSALAQAASENSLTNADVVKMVKAGLPESIILREIQMSRTSFAATPAALIELKRHGASEAVMGAVMDSWSSGGMPMQEALPPGGTMQSAWPHSAHMPTFKADLRVNGKTHEKLSMSHNQIKMEGNGVPAVSVEWQSSNPAAR